MTDTIQMGRTKSLRIIWLAILVLLAYLWFWVYATVHLEWSTNQQYSYGWVVPFLCVGLVIRNWTSYFEKEGMNAFAFSKSRFSGWSARMAFVCGVFLFLPARAIAASTPEWRPLQWLMALIAVGITLYFIFYIWGRRGLVLSAFPVCFFLVAVPWPSPVEQPIIQGLTSTDASFVVDLMGILGIPAVQHGNVIEVGTGIVGIDEACSGIRSFQSSLMISLFLGEFYRLTWMRRLVLFAGGIVISFGFNVCRTAYLTWIGAKKGINAISLHHDSAGFMVLIVCTVAIWLVSLLLARKTSGKKADASQPSPAEVKAEGGIKRIFELPEVMVTGIRSTVVVLAIWFVMVEAGVRLWYWHLESHLVLGPNWTMVMPTNNPSFKAVKLTENTYGLLRYDDGVEGDWENSQGIHFHGFYFDWHPGRVAGYLAKRHTPEICLAATGMKLKKGPDLFVASVNGISLPIRQYEYEVGGSMMHVFHSRWEAGTDPTKAAQYESTRFNLIRGIWGGRGKYGQKVIEILISGEMTSSQARTVLIHELDTMIKVERKPEKKKS